MADTERLMDIAQDTLAFFDTAATQADEALRSYRTPTPNALANVNALTSVTATQTLVSIGRDQRAAWLSLATEPAIARLHVLDENEQPLVLYVTRGTPPNLRLEGVKVASYRSPMGRLAAVSVGVEEEIRLPGGFTHYLVDEKVTLRPVRPNNEWDAKDTIVQRQNVVPITIASLRALIGDSGISSDPADILHQLLQQEDVALNIHQGIVRSVIEKMALRDRPLLDRYQDEIYRLPLGTRMAIMGPPGSGKTTTLIKRLGLKLDLEYLDEDERGDVESSEAGEGGHSTSWMMFTPTELLKLYIKEAFAREGIAAPDQRIKTWDEYRRELARQTLGFLQTATSAGAVMRVQPNLLKDDALSRSTAWYEDFFGWQDDHFWKGLAEHAERLVSSGNDRVRRVGNAIRAVLSRKVDGTHVGAVSSLLNATAEITQLLSSSRAEINAELERAFAEQLRSNDKLLNELLEFLKAETTSEEALDDLDEAELEEEESAAPTGTLRDAFEAYKRAARAQARGAALGRKPGARSRNGRIIQWLGTHALSDEQAKKLGDSILLVDSLGRFSNPVDHYVNRIARRYRSFRKLRQSEGLWYKSDPVAANELDPLEVDLIILAMLRSAIVLLGDRTVMTRVQEGRHQTLQSVKGLYRNQIIVDEATDFSPIQLASMAALCDPAIRSFVACGDFDQRLTHYGSRSLEDLSWAIPSIDVRSIVITYRHSKQLNAFAARLTASPGVHSNPASLPEHLVTDGFDPVVGVSLSGENLADWLADRILEIEHKNQQLPSIAILVNDEARLNDVAQLLHTRLEIHNLRCVACPNGQVRGQDSDVRVFSVQHIKGLEFEAVFFVDVDRLASEQKDLFEKYLYVGATRAATYLGLTCSSAELPSQLERVADALKHNWKVRTQA